MGGNVEIKEKDFLCQLTNDHSMRSNCEKWMVRLRRSARLVQNITSCLFSADEKCLFSTELEFCFDHFVLKPQQAFCREHGLH